MAIAEHENAAEAFAKNRERLRTERLAREAGEASPAADAGMKASQMPRGKNDRKRIEIATH